MTRLSSAETSRRYRERHPERVRAANLARNDYKREWEAGECPLCGGRLADAKRTEVCASCRKAENERKFKDTAQHFIKLREQGLLNCEIERREGLLLNTVSQCLSEAKKRFGMHIPRSPYFKAPA